MKLITCRYMGNLIEATQFVNYLELARVLFSMQLVTAPSSVMLTFKVESLAEYNYVAASLELGTLTTSEYYSFTRPETARVSAY